MADSNDREAEQALSQAQRIINEAREGKLEPTPHEELPFVAHTLLEAVAYIQRMEAQNGMLCVRMNTASDIILALVFNLQEEIGRTHQASHEMMLHQLQLIGSVLVDHHEAYHILRSG